MRQRKIVQIDEEKCDGCGLCASACAEGAIRIIDGKARLVSDVTSMAWGACLGECPQGAIAIVEREAEAFDEEATRRHLAGLKMKEQLAAAPLPQVTPKPFHFAPTGWPRGRGAEFFVEYGAWRRDGRSETTGAGESPSLPGAGEPPTLPSAFIALAGAAFAWCRPTRRSSRMPILLLVADCVPFAYADFHRRFLQGRPIVIGCPKLDDPAGALDKLTAILSMSAVRSLTVIHMEVPCCTGLVRIAQAALAASGRYLPLEEEDVTIFGSRRRFGVRRFITAFFGGRPRALKP